MNNIRVTVLLVLSFLAVIGNAGMVHWDTFEGCSTSVFLDDGTAYGSYVPCYNIFSYGPFGTPEICLVYDTDWSQRRYSGTTYWGGVNCGNPTAYWVMATAGEVLSDLSDYKSHPLVFNCYEEFDFAQEKTGTIRLSPVTETYYLALLGESHGPYWGWVEVQGDWNNGFSVVHSALSADGPLIVGGGLFNPSGDIPNRQAVCSCLSAQRCCC